MPNCSYFSMIWMNDDMLLLEHLNQLAIGSQKPRPNSTLSGLGEVVE